MPQPPPYMTLFQAIWWIAFREIQEDIKAQSRGSDEVAEADPADGLEDRHLSVSRAEAFLGAEQELLHRLQTGALVATGRDTADQRREIPDFYWQDAVLDPLASAANSLSTNQGMVDLAMLSRELREGFASGESWYDITVSAAILVKLWPGGTAASNTKYAQASVKACQDYLIGLMREGPPARAKDEYRRECTARFNISGEAFKRAWSNAADVVENPDWTKPGRRRKSKG